MGWLSKMLQTPLGHSAYVRLSSCLRIVQGERRGKVVPVVAQEAKLDLALGGVMSHEDDERRVLRALEPPSAHRGEGCNSVSIELRDLVLEFSLWLTCGSMVDRFRGATGCRLRPRWGRGTGPRRQGACTARLSVEDTSSSSLYIST